MIVAETIVYEPTPYTSRIHAEHLEPTLIPKRETSQLSVRRDWQYVLDREAESGEPWVKDINDVTVYADMFIADDPAGYEIARDVDGGGVTNRAHEPLRFTHWTEASNTGVFMRFAEARTAGHPGGVLRSPVMGGLALELTLDPESVSPLDAHTMYVIGRSRTAKESAINVAKEAAAYDLSEFMDEPLYVGPLYNGHPNRIPNGVRTTQLVALSRYMFDKLAGIETAQPSE